MQINEIRDDVQVTVICITYNHEEIIKEALESFLMQETNFKYQIFVGEDKGPDNTAQVVKEYAQKYPDKIVAFLRDENMGAQHNLIDLCQRAKSPYLAFCEGDDFWIDKYKLQKQYDYMEANEDVNVCFALAQVDAPQDWFLRDYFKADKQGRILSPTSDPLCPDLSKKVKNNSFINIIGHTSTLFYRWNYDIHIPDWYYEGIIGDYSLFLMQLADGYAFMLPEVMTVYRRSEVGVYMSNNMDEHFMKTRLEWLRIMGGMIDYYEENEITDFPKQQMIERMRKELNNYLGTVIQCGDLDAIKTVIDKYPQRVEDILSLYTSYYSQNRWMIDLYSWDGKQLLVANKYFMHLIKPFIRFAGKCHKLFKKVKYGFKNFIVYMLKLVGYWFYSLFRKRKNLWVFSGFMKNTYVDNVKYLFEYISEHHPEIEAVWLTKDPTIYEEITKKGYRVEMMRSRKGIMTTARAAVAVLDHFVMSDYSSIYGYNHRTKVVQLWHGVGFKSMGDEQKVQNTTVPGVMYSRDILPHEGDSFVKRGIKKVKYFFKAPVRELFEEYFMMVCPGQERVEMIADKWSVPMDARFMAGHPRNIVVYDRMGETKRQQKILYAPTYRFNYNREKKLVMDCLAAADMIQRKMEEIDGQFILRLHPHTWRNYKPIIIRGIKDYNRISLDAEDDIYKSILEYKVIITDYSSIGLDGSLFHIPCVFYIPDYNWFVKNEAGFGVDFLNQTPGPKTQNWEDTLKEVLQFVKNTDYMIQEREEIIKYYFSREANNRNDSENITQEIIRKLK